MSTEWINSTVKRLRSAKVYLKTDYKPHVTEESPSADHYQVYALSSDEKLKTSAPLVRTSVILNVKDVRILIQCSKKYRQS